MDKKNTSKKSQSPGLRTSAAASGGGSTTRGHHHHRRSSPSPIGKSKSPGTTRLSQKSSDNSLTSNNNNTNPVKATPTSTSTSRKRKSRSKSSGKKEKDSSGSGSKSNDDNPETGSISDKGSVGKSTRLELTAEAITKSMIVPLQMLTNATAPATLTANSANSKPAPTSTATANLQTSTTKPVPTKKESNTKLSVSLDNNKENNPIKNVPSNTSSIGGSTSSRSKPVNKPLTMAERVDLTMSNAKSIAVANNSTASGTSNNSSVKSVTYSSKPIINLLPLQIQANKSGTSTTTTSSKFRENLIKAVKEHKIFSLNSNYPSHIRNSLKARGWVEKPHVGVLNVKTCIGSHLTRDVDLRGSEDERDETWAARVLDKYPSDFVWVVRRDNVEWRAMLKDQLINRFPRANFTTKVGITSCLQTMHWHTEIGLSDTFFPRCYRLSIEEEKLGFIDDFRLSACISLLKWLCSSYERFGESGVSEKDSPVTVLCIDFAVRQVNNYVRTRRHEDVDWIMPPTFSSSHWETFLKQYYEIVHNKRKLGVCDSTDTHGIYGKFEMAKKALTKLKPYWPQFNIDGLFNIWICKPGARSRGKGIIILNELEKVLELLSNGHQREANWVVQKYIENPLLIYKTKFDIRQWFIVTDWAPLTIWFYKESYVRFCSKPFTLEDFHESIHLCNNAIQANYTNAEGRDSNLPDENMWDSYTFQAYLKTIGKLDSWSKIIYPGMKESITGVMLSSQEQVEPRRNCFELYGADFMLDSELRPWLIEINSCPCMAGTTSVTARMCAQCLEDLVKVVVDRRDSKNADTGLFEMIYRQNPATYNVQQFGGVDLFIQGKKLPKDVDWPGIMTKYNSKRLVPAPVTRSTQKSSGASGSTGSGLTFFDLVQKLKLSEQSDGSTTPHSQRVIDESHAVGTVSNYIPKAIEHEAVPRPYKTASGNKNNKSSNYGISDGKTVIEKTPVITFKGFPPKPTFPEAPADNKEMSMPGGIPWQTFNRNVVNNQPYASPDKSRGMFTDMSVLIRNPHPVAPTMADLLRISQENEDLLNKVQNETKHLKGLTTNTTGAAAAATTTTTNVSPRQNTNKTKKGSAKTKGNSNIAPYAYGPSQTQTRNVVDESINEAIAAIKKSIPLKKVRLEDNTNPGL